MAETEFIGPGGIVRQTILNSQTGQTATAAVLNANPAGQWTSIKPETTSVAVASTSQNTAAFYPTAYFDHDTNAIQQSAASSAAAAATSAPPQNSLHGTASAAGGNKKVKHRTVTAMTQHSSGQPVTVSLAPVDIKPIPQTIIAQCSNAWTTGPGNNGTAVTLSDNAGVNTGYQTIKWEHANPIAVVSASKQNTTTLNTTGLHFISAPAAAAAAAAGTAATATAVSPAAAAAMTPSAMVPGGMNVLIHGGRKTGTIIETFKCEVCNQIFSSMNALQTHVAQVHEVGLTKRGQGKKTNFPSSTLHCEYKYSGLSLADSISGAVATAAQPQQQPQQLPTIIATGGPVVSGSNLINTGGATFIQAPTNLTITSIGGSAASAAGQSMHSPPPGGGHHGESYRIITKNGKIRKEKKRNWECVMCHNRFSRKDHLAKHVSAVHEKIRPFECMQCGQKFSQKHHLRAHMLARHEDDKMAAKAFACQQCPKRFTRNDHLERHIESGMYY